MDLADLGDAHCGTDLQCGSVVTVLPLAYTGAHAHYHGCDGGGEIFQGLGELAGKKILSRRKTDGPK